MKKIYVLRHAKAVPAGHFPTDHERPLTPQGKAAARMVGEYLQSMGADLDQVICSDSERTRQTWQEVAKSLGEKIPVTYSRKLYLATPQTILSLIHALPDDTDSVLVIGHNPGMHQLCAELAVRDDAEAWDELELSFPTASLAVISCDVASWGLVDWDSGRLSHYLSRKEMTALGIMAEGA